MLDEREFESYDEAWRWSVDARTAGAFWAEISRTAAVHWYDEPIDVMQRDTASVTGVRWFPGGTLNYAELALTDPASAVTLSSLADPESLAPFLELARTRFGEDSASA
jgi:hypothetical protein